MRATAFLPSASALNGWGRRERRAVLTAAGPRLNLANQAPLGPRDRRQVSCVALACTSSAAHLGRAAAYITSTAWCAPPQGRRGPAVDVSAEQVMDAESTCLMVSSLPVLLAELGEGTASFLSFSAQL